MVLFDEYLLAHLAVLLYTSKDLVFVLGLATRVLLHVTVMSLDSTDKGSMVIETLWHIFNLTILKTDANALI